MLLTDAVSCDKIFVLEWFLVFSRKKISDLGLHNAKNHWHQSAGNAAIESIAKLLS